MGCGPSTAAAAQVSRQASNVTVRSEPSCRSGGKEDEVGGGCDKTQVTGSGGCVDGGGAGGDGKEVNEDVDDGVTKDVDGDMTKDVDSVVTKVMDDDVTKDGVDNNADEDNKDKTLDDPTGGTSERDNDVSGGDDAASTGDKQLGEQKLDITNCSGVGGGEDVGVGDGGFTTNEGNVIFALTAVEKESQHVFDPDSNSDLDKAVSALLSNVASEVEKELKEDVRGLCGGNKSDGLDARGSDQEGTSCSSGERKDDSRKSSDRQSVSCGSDEQLPDLSAVKCNDGDDGAETFTDRTAVSCGSDEPLPDLKAIGGNVDGDVSKVVGGGDTEIVLCTNRTSVSCGDDDPLPDLKGGDSDRDSCTNRTSVSCGSDDPLPDLNVVSGSVVEEGVGGMVEPDISVHSVSGVPLLDLSGVKEGMADGPCSGSGNKIGSSGDRGEIILGNDNGQLGDKDDDSDSVGFVDSGGDYGVLSRLMGSVASAKGVNGADNGEQSSPQQSVDGIAEVLDDGRDEADEDNEEEEGDFDEPDGLRKALGLSKKSKEEKKVKEAQKKLKKKDPKLSVTSAGSFALEEFPTAPENSAIPLFVYKCVCYIDAEGLQTEGLYRIPGNKSQGELFLSKFVEDPNTDIDSLSISVNAIATLIKNFFNELSEPLIPSNVRDELMEAAEMGDKSGRLLMLRGVIKKLPDQNYELLKYIMTHLFRVAQNQEHNSMSSSNLAKCWWPTLLRLEFKSYEKMIQGTQIPEDIVHALIEQAQFFFYGGNEV